MLGRWSCVALLAWAVMGGPALAAEWDEITINGYASFEFERQIEGAGEGDGDPNGSFDADLIDLVLGFQVSDRLRVAMDVTWEHGSATDDDRGNVALEYGFAEYALSDLIKFRVGKMFTPFGIFNEIHTAKPAFLAVKESPATNKPERIVDGAYRFFPRWGTGIGLQGEGMIRNRSFDYDLFISNGEQDNTNPFEEDDNIAKAFAARFRVEPTQNLRVGASFYYDHITEPGFDAIWSYGLQFQYEALRLRVLAEAVLGRKELTAGGSIDQLGWFVQPSFHFGNGVTPYVQFGHIDPDRSASDDTGFNFIVGVNFEVSPWFMIKLENSYFKGDAGSSLGAFPGRDYNEIKAALVVGF
jgi:hypothetical protein